MRYQTSGRSRLLEHAIALSAWLISIPALAASSGQGQQAAPASSRASNDQSISRRFGDIMLVYPKDNAVISAPSTFLIGSCPPGSKLFCQGNPVRLNAQGFFAQVVSLSPGDNAIKLVLNDQAERIVNVRREDAYKPIAPAMLSVKPDPVAEQEDRGVVAGDLVPFVVRATPDARVAVHLGGRIIPLQPCPSGLNQGLDYAYGKAFQRRRISGTDLYCGFYRVRAGDRFQNLSPAFVASKGKRSLKWTAPYRLSIVGQPLPAATVHDDTIVRLGPGQARTTPLPKGVRLTVDGWQGKSMRCLLSPSRHIWVLKEDLSINQAGSYGAASAVRAINVLPGEKETALAIPLSQRLPFQLEQKLNPNQIVLSIFGATADIDWISQSPSAVASDLIDHVTWRQAGDQVCEVTVLLNRQRQWGFQAGYDGNNLVLRIKAPPRIGAGAKPLDRLIICLDPGHGGGETGAIGPSGIKESAINLSVAEQLKSLLTADGAQVIMTREDDRDAALDQRVKASAGADLLISIHNNALPDGRDPWAEHGTSSYWYHPQSLELARTLKNHLAKALDFPDFGANYQNLALTRPSSLLAVLIEVGFMIHPDEYAQLVQPAVQLKAARAIEEGIVDYMERATRRTGQ